MHPRDDQACRNPRTGGEGIERRSYPSAERAIGARGSEPSGSAVAPIGDSQNAKTAATPAGSGCGLATEPADLLRVGRGDAHLGVDVVVLVDAAGARTRRTPLPVTLVLPMRRGPGCRPARCRCCGRRYARCSRPRAQTGREAGEGVACGDAVVIEGRGTLRLHAEDVVLQRHVVRRPGPGCRRRIEEDPAARAVAVGAHDGVPDEHLQGGAARDGGSEVDTGAVGAAEVVDRALLDMGAPNRRRAR